MQIFIVSAGAVAFLLLAIIILQFVSGRRLRQRYHEAREELIRLETQLQHEKQRQSDEQALIEEFKLAARASVMATGAELSSKLLQDHKREADALRETFLKDKKEENKDIREFMIKLREQLSQAEKLSLDNKQQNDILWRTFSSPSSTGRLAEVGLDNLLKNMGLRPGMDYSMQYTITSGQGAGLRPDCVIKLPNGRVVVIDCKASKHVLAMAEAQGTEQEAECNQQFLHTMREHLKALARKDYRDAIQQDSLLQKSTILISQITNVMYLPSSACVELLYRLDPDLIDRSEKQGIILIGPGQLHGLIALISKEISDERKLENQEKIIHEVERLLGSLAVTFGHLTKVGSSLKSLTQNFSKISGSFNSQVAPKLRNLGKLGITPQGTTKMPDALESYELRSLSDTLDIESSDQEPVSLEDYREQKESA